MDGELGDIALRLTAAGFPDADWVLREALMPSPAEYGLLISRFQSPFLKSEVAMNVKRRGRLREAAITWIAWHLPRELVYWCAIRLGSAATSGKHGSTEVSGLTFFDALERWNNP